MKKTALSLFLLTALFIAYLLVMGGESELGQAVPEESSTKPRSFTITDRTASADQESKNDEAIGGGRSLPSVEGVAEASEPVVPALYFPEAKVISMVEARGERADEIKRIKVVETSMAQPFVRIVETYSMAGGSRQLVSQAAMVANQILLDRPEALSEAEFMGILYQAGAVEVAGAGASFLATFTAHPEDPLALEAFMTRLKEAAQVDLVTEPNYLRQII